MMRLNVAFAVIAIMVNPAAGQRIDFAEQNRKYEKFIQEFEKVFGGLQRNPTNLERKALVFQARIQATEWYQDWYRLAIVEEHKNLVKKNGVFKEELLRGPLSDSEKAWWVRLAAEEEGYALKATTLPPFSTKFHPFGHNWLMQSIVTTNHFGEGNIREGVRGLPPDVAPRALRVWWATQ